MNDKTPAKTLREISVQLPKTSVPIDQIRSQASHIRRRRRSLGGASAITACAIGAFALTGHHWPERTTQTAADSSGTESVSTAPTTSSAVADSIMIAVPTSVRPGDPFEVTFSEVISHSVTYSMSAVAEGAGTVAEPAYYLSTLYPGGPESPSWTTAASYTTSVEVGNSTAGPDNLVLPDSAPPGTWRICALDTLTPTCVDVEVASP